MARPRESTDQQLLDAARRVLATTGARGFTLAKVASAAGVSPAALVKRFGSKHRLLVELSRAWVDSIDVAPRCEGGLAALFEMALTPYADTADNAATHLSALAVDLEDAQLRELLAEGWARRRLQLQHCFSAAATELPYAPPPPLAAHMVFALLEGVFLGWSVRPEGDLEHVLRTHLATLVESWKERPHPHAREH